MYSWVVNQSKYKRAYSKSESKTEEDIKQIYISLGGLVKDQPVKKGKSKKNVE